MRCSHLPVISKLLDTNAVSQVTLGPAVDCEFSEQRNGAQGEQAKASLSLMLGEHFNYTYLDMQELALRGRKSGSENFLKEKYVARWQDKFCLM